MSPKLTMREFHEVNQATGTVQRALRDDPEYRAWYRRTFPKSPYGRPIGFARHTKGRGRGKVHPIHAQESRRRKTMFGKARYKTYAAIVSLESPAKAEEAAEKLLHEFKKARSRAKQVRIKQVTTLAANRADALAKNNLSAKEYAEATIIGAVYDDAKNQMRIPPKAR